MTEPKVVHEFTNNNTDRCQVRDDCALWIEDGRGVLQIEHYVNGIVVDELARLAARVAELEDKLDHMKILYGDSDAPSPEGVIHASDGTSEPLMEE